MPPKDATPDMEEAVCKLLNVEKSRIKEIKPLPGGMSGMAFCLTLRKDDGSADEEEYVLRQVKEVEFEALVTRSVAEQGIGPKLLAASETASSAPHFIVVAMLPWKTVALEQFLPGGPSQVETVIHRLGETVATFHALSPSDLGLKRKGDEISSFWFPLATTAFTDDAGTQLKELFAAQLKESERFLPYSFDHGGNAKPADGLFLSSVLSDATAFASHGDLHFGNFLATDSCDEMALVDLDRVAARRPGLDLAYLFIAWGDQYLAKGKFAMPGPTDISTPPLPYPNLDARRQFMRAYLVELKRRIAARLESHRSGAAEEQNLGALERLVNTLSDTPSEDDVDAALFEVECCTLAERLRLYCVYLLIAGGDAKHPMIQHGVAPGLNFMVPAARELLSSATDASTKEAILEHGLLVLAEWNAKKARQQEN